MLRVLMRPPESEVSTLLLFALREMGGLFVMLSLLLSYASRDPERNVAIIDAVTAGLLVLAVTPLIRGRSLVRLALAALLFYLRPRDAVGGNPS